MASGFRKVAPRRTHHERAQPRARARFGILEKHKDYVLRAKNYHLKSRRISALRSKARFRNQDEFYHGMIKSRTKDGRHRSTRPSVQYTGDTLKLLKTQDAGYIRLQRSINAKQLESLVSAEPAVLPAVMPSEHILFVDDNDANGQENEKQVDENEAIAAVEARAAVCTRLAIADLRRRKLQVNSSATARRVERLISSRRAREEQLAQVEHALNTQRNLMKKGRRVHAGVDKHGETIYKWKPERKR